jgi:hypothetical protein
VITITATDRDGGDFGTEGIRYEMSGSDLFTVDPISGKITVAPCQEACLVINFIGAITPEVSIHI